MDTQLGHRLLRPVESFQDPGRHSRLQAKDRTNPPKAAKAGRLSRDGA